MCDKSEITIIGTGAVGSSLAMALHESGYHIRTLVSRSHDRAVKLSERVGNPAVKKELKPDESGDIIFLCIPDDAIASYAQQHTNGSSYSGKIIVHTSGVHSASALNDFKRAGATICSAHPLQTFPGTEMTSLKNVWVTLNGDDTAKKALEHIFQNLGAETVSVTDDQKAKLHLAAVMVCNYMVALVKAADDIAGNTDIDIKTMMMPLMEKTLENIASKSLSDALSGPIKRGDTGTLRKHINLLKDDHAAENLYKLLGGKALELTNGLHSNELYTTMAHILEVKQHDIEN